MGLRNRIITALAVLCFAGGVTPLALAGFSEGGFKAGKVVTPFGWTWGKDGE